VLLKLQFPKHKNMPADTHVAPNLPPL